MVCVLYGMFTYKCFTAESIKKWSLFSHTLNLAWPCNLLWPIECSRNDDMQVKPRSQESLQRPLLPSWNTALRMPCKEVTPGFRSWAEDEKSLKGELKHSTDSQHRLTNTRMRSFWTFQSSHTFTRMMLPEWAQEKLLVKPHRIMRNYKSLL